MPASAYLDHNATSPLRPAAFDAMVEALRAGGNPSSVHRAGRAARSLIDGARRQVAALVGALPAEIVFTSGGTEANNMAIDGSGRKRVLVSSIEHDSVLKAAPDAEIIPVDGNGVVDLGALERMLALPGEPALVSVMFANNETGVCSRSPMSFGWRARPAHWCIAMPCRPPARCGSICTVSASIISASRPTSSAAPRVSARWSMRSGAPFAPDRRGGGQESNRRAGTENVAGIAGFGAAAAASREGLMVEGLRDRMERSLLAIAPGARVFGAGARRLGNTSCISMPGVKAETQVMALDLAGICVSAGAACSSGKVHRSAVLVAMGVEDAVAETAIRISCGWNTESDDIERLIAAWRDLYIRVVQSDIRQARAA